MSSLGLILPPPDRMSYTIPELLATLEDAIRRRVDELGDTRNHLIYQDASNALDGT
jgi:hypothetical protein